MSENSSPVTRMIKSISQKAHLAELDLTRTVENTFMLLTYAKTIGYFIGLSEEEIKDVLNEMQSGDYEHLIEVFDENFGEFVIIYR